jgi:hypothetical protein
VACDALWFNRVVAADRKIKKVGTLLAPTVIYLTEPKGKLNDVYPDMGLSLFNEKYPFRADQDISLV